MFDTTKDINPAGDILAKTGGHPDILERGLDKVEEAFRKASVGQHLEGPRVVNRVEGFGGVEEEGKVLRVVLDSFEEVFVDS